LRFSHREPEFPTIASQHRFVRRKRLLETTNQPPIAILVEHYPISWRYVNLGDLFTETGNFLCFGGLEEINWHHPAQHDRRRPVHARGPQRKAQADPCAEGLAGEPVAIWEFVTSGIIDGEFFSWIEKFSREPEVIELVQEACRNRSNWRPEDLS
jgi:hypothetical protein